jgi:hypothetical protein
MSDDIDLDLDFDLSSPLNKLAWKTGLKIGREMRHTVDQMFNTNEKKNSNKDTSDGPLFDYDNL